MPWKTSENQKFLMFSTLNSSERNIIETMVIIFFHQIEYREEDQRQRTKTNSGLDDILFFKFSFWDTFWYIKAFIHYEKWTIIF